MTEKAALPDMNVIPTYAYERFVAGLHVDDPDYPDNYAVPAPGRPLQPEHQEQLASRFREALANK